MTKLLEDCEGCDTKNSLVRLPTAFFYNSTIEDTPRPTGTLVKESIEDFKKDLELEKEQIKNMEWKEND